MTGRHAIRSGTHSASMVGESGGLVAWERTLGDILSEAGYATASFGKWHIGAAASRWPTEHGFDEWLGIPHRNDECFWIDDPWYDPAGIPRAALNIQVPDVAVWVCRCFSRNCRVH